MEQLQAALTSSLGAGGSSPGVLQLLQQLQAGSIGVLDVHICSPGGVGSTSLSTFLTRHGFRTNLLMDTDGLRHSPLPPAWCMPGAPDTPHPSKPRTVLYMYGDPYEVVASHYRRGHAYHQACKTSRHPLGPVDAFPATAEAYFARGEDLFGLQSHWRSWVQGANAYDILVLRYESMFDPSLAHQLFQQLCGHKCSHQQVLQLAQEWVASKTPRVSQVPAAVRQGGMYAGLMADMASLPGLHGVPARRQGVAHEAAQQQALDDLSQLMTRTH